MEGQFIFLFTWILHVTEACNYSFTFPTLNGSVYTVQENEYISLPFNLTSACGVAADVNSTTQQRPDDSVLDNIAAAGVGALVMASVGVTVIVVCKRCKGEEAEVVPEQLARDYSDVVDTVENTAVDESGAAQAVVVVVNDDDGDFTSRVTLVNEQNQPADSLTQHAAPPMDLPALFGADTGGPRDYVSVSKIRDAKRRAMDETQCFLAVLLFLFLMNQDPAMASDSFLCSDLQALPQ
ncbi:hypothetical protein BaRGS_00013340 [Batillaria attramentaria]|uniref:Uncharacterized protein n=1 Tax=Batillaria attramentaria TaxID=370345 RepID=A0ABD0L763_9CAEN